MKNLPITTEHLIELLLPAELFLYFELVGINTEQNVLRIYLDERAVKPEEYSDQELISKGFYPEIEVQDFPLRRRKVLLCVRRRKWQVVSSGKIVSKSWTTSAEGTRYSEEFAAFLKGVHGFLPDQFDFT